MGTYSQSNGLNTVTTLNIGTLGSVSGFGYVTTGTYTQTGGSTSAGTVNLGSSTAGQGGNGTYNLNGGTLSVGAGRITGGSVGTSTFSFNGGTLTPTAASTTFMQGLTSANVQSGGAIIDTAGLNITIGQALLTSGTTTETLTKNGSGTLTLSGANTYGGDTTVSNGTLAFGADNVIPSGSGNGNVAVNSGATLDLAGHNATINGLNDGGGGGGRVDSTVAGTPILTVGGNDATSAFSGTIQNTAGTLSLTKIGAGTVTLSGGLNYTGQTVIKAGTLKAIGVGGVGLVSGVLTSSGGLDVQGGQAVWDYTGVTYNSTLVTPGYLDPLVESELQQSYLNNWAIDPTHLVGSTTANADYIANGASATHALGWTDTVVGGENLLTVMYTLYGDTDLNGTVNGADLNTVLSNYQQTGQYWYQGDFDYNGTVNGADLNILLSNYQQHLSVGAAVPEPSTLLLAAAGLLGLLAYAWRKQK